MRAFGKSTDKHGVNVSLAVEKSFVRRGDQPCDVLHIFPDDRGCDSVTVCKGFKDKLRK